MSSFVSALDKPPARGAAHDGGITDSATRLRESLAFLRYVEDVEISSDMGRNWDAKKCFVIHVTVKDSQVEPEKGAKAAQLTVVRPSAPFQIERTPKQLQELQTTILHWSSQHDSETQSSCTFCGPITSGAVTTAAKREANEDLSRGKGRGGGFFSSLFKGSPSKLKSGDEWESWLNLTIRSVRRVDAEEGRVCEGITHAAPLVARFLLQEFASDVIF